MAEDQLHIRAAGIGEQHCEDLEPDRAIEAVLADDRMVWVDIRWEDAEQARDLLQERLHLHPLAVEDALNPRERPAVQIFEGTLFMSVLVPHKEGTEVKFEELAFFLRQRSLVTVSHTALTLVDDWFESWKDHPNRVGKEPVYLMHALVDAAVDSYFPMLDEIEDVTDEVTDRIFNGDATQLPRIMRLKRALLDLRRAITPTRDVLNSLLRRDVEQIPDHSKIYFQDVYDHALRLGELIDTNRDALTSVLDVHLSTVSNSLNVIVKKMTVLSTVLMTMALIAGIYGMNFDHMPELHWRFGYAFALGLMLLSALATLGIFKLIRWL